jgi:hypothetical protein
MSFAAITLRVASQRVFIIVFCCSFVMTQSGNFWIHPRIVFKLKHCVYILRSITHSHMSYSSHAANITRADYVKVKGKGKVDPVLN